MIYKVDPMTPQEAVINLARKGMITDDIGCKLLGVSYSEYKRLIVKTPYREVIISRQRNYIEWEERKKANKEKKKRLNQAEMLAKRAVKRDPELAKLSKLISLREIAGLLKKKAKKLAKRKEAQKRNEF